ncbi:MAG: hypothetical protein ABL929_12145 [Ferruginibacter sp.]
MPQTTANKGAGIIFNFFAKGCCNMINTDSDTSEIIMAPIVISWLKFLRFAKKLLLENKFRKPLLQKSGLS